MQVRLIATLDITSRCMPHSLSATEDIGSPLTISRPQSLGAGVDETHVGVVQQLSML